MLARLRNDERGQILPALFLVSIVTVGGSLMLFQLGRATTMSASAQTGADAAALAATSEVKRALVVQLEEISELGEDEVDDEDLPELDPSLIPQRLPCNRAREYAGLNGTTVTFCRYYPTTLSVRVRVQTTETLDGAYGLPGTRGQSAEARAHARVIQAGQAEFWRVRLRPYD